MPEQSTTLRDMIQEALDTGETYRSLAQRAVDPDTGKTASYGLINNIVLGNTRSAPEPHHLRAIAAALRVPYEKVRQAAIAQWLPAEDGMTPEEEEADRAQLREEALFLRNQLTEALDRIDRLGESGSHSRRPKSA